MYNNKLVLRQTPSLVPNVLNTLFGTLLFPIRVYVERQVYSYYKFRLNACTVHEQSVVT